MESTLPTKIFCAECAKIKYYHIKINYLLMSSSLILLVTLSLTGTEPHSSLPHLLAELLIWVFYVSFSWCSSEYPSKYPNTQCSDVWYHPFLTRVLPSTPWILFTSRLLLPISCFSLAFKMFGRVFDYHPATCLRRICSHDCWAVFLHLQVMSAFLCCLIQRFCLVFSMNGSGLALRSFTCKWESRRVAYREAIRK